MMTQAPPEDDHGQKNTAPPSMIPGWPEFALGAPTTTPSLNTHTHTSAHPHTHTHKNTHISNQPKHIYDLPLQLMN